MAGNDAFVQALAAKLVAMGATHETKPAPVVMESTLEALAPADKVGGEVLVDYGGIQTFTYTTTKTVEEPIVVRTARSVMSTSSSRSGRSARSRGGNYTFNADRLTQIDEDNAAMAKRLEAVGRQRSTVSFRSVDTSPVIVSNRANRHNLQAQRIAKENRRLMGRLTDAKARVYDDAAARAKYDRSMFIQANGKVRRVGPGRRQRTGRSPSRSGSSLSQQHTGQYTVADVARMGGRRWGLAQLSTPGHEDSLGSVGQPGPTPAPGDSANPQDLPSPPGRAGDSADDSSTFLTQTVGIVSPSRSPRTRGRLPAKGTPHPARARRPRAERSRPWAQGPPGASPSRSPARSGGGHKRGGSSFPLTSPGKTPGAGSFKPSGRGSPRGGASPRATRALSPRAARQKELRERHAARKAGSQALVPSPPPGHGSKTRQHYRHRKYDKPWASNMAVRVRPDPPLKQMLDRSRSARRGGASPRGRQEAASRSPRRAGAASGSQFARTRSPRTRAASPRGAGAGSISARSRSPRTRAASPRNTASARLQHLTGRTSPRRGYDKPWTANTSRTAQAAATTQAAFTGLGRTRGWIDPGAIAPGAPEPDLGALDSRTRAQVVRRAAGLSVAGAGVVAGSPAPAPKPKTRVAPRRRRAHAEMY